MPYAIRHEGMRLLKLDQMCRVQDMVQLPSLATTFGTMEAAQHVRDWLQQTKVFRPGSLSIAPLNRTAD
jgi:hypothetical protein